MLYFLEVQFQRDVKFYARFFSEIFLYLYQTESTHPWQAVVIYPSRSVEVQGSSNYAELLTSPQIRQTYLDQLAVESSVGPSTLQLVSAPGEQALAIVRRLIREVREQIADEVIKQELIELTETIMVYKLPQKSCQEIEAIFGLLELKQRLIKKP